MATARDIVTRALRKRIKQAGLVPEAIELEEGLTDLNSMLADWESDGIGFGHVALAASDTLDVPDNHIQTVVLSLAERLTEYGGSMDPMDVLQADRGRSALRAQYFNMADLTSDNPLSLRNLSNEN